MSKVDVYEIVTNEIIAALEEDVVPWSKPWNSTPHKNLKNNYTYRGINQMLCEMYVQRYGYEHPYWMTFKNVSDMGGKVKKGEKSHIVVLWRFIKSKETDANGEPLNTFPILRYYRVFNIDQTEGIEIPDEEVKKDNNPIKAAQEIIDNWGDKPDIMHGGDMAAYNPMLDVIHMPKLNDFVDSPAYYTTLFHESVHATGHKDRLAREEITKATITFGDTDYSREELVAEIGAAMLAAHTGIDPSTKERSKAYVKHWLKALKNDKKMVITASSRAQKAVEHIVGDSDE